ncbi:hypothetical protein NW768_003773 [Fusarium equiseti]|uniref:Uncharacterized protein n=1 Tax=Fusarium equiseti TaxID=61235 RepID=A0ABQ8RII1_FUSEQ|nr:hypothetical protein NW768_003773 [Fusarium equiseti]
MNRLGIRYMDARIQVPKDKDHGGHNIIHNGGNDTVFQIQILLALRYMDSQLVERFRQGCSLVEGDDALPWLPYKWSGHHIDLVNVAQDLSLAPKTKGLLEKNRTKAQHNNNEIDQVLYEKPGKSKQRISSILSSSQVYGNDNSRTMGGDGLVYV